MILNIRYVVYYFTKVLLQGLSDFETIYQSTGKARNQLTIG